MENLKHLTPEQRAQIERQVEMYESQEASFKREHFAVGNQNLDLIVHKFVADPQIMNSGLQVVDFLAERPELVRGKVVTDMGTGSGIIGLSAALLGAKQVYMPDLDFRATNCAWENIVLNKLDQNCQAFESDLFNNYGDRPQSDVQIFNHPFFPDQPIAGKEWTRMMLGGTELLERYFQEAPRYSTLEAIYILPWLTLAGREDNLDNDPGKRASEYGFEIVDVLHQKPVNTGIQQHLFKIYTLKRDSDLSLD